MVGFGSSGPDLGSLIYNGPAINKNCHGFLVNHRPIYAGSELKEAQIDERDKNREIRGLKVMGQDISEVNFIGLKHQNSFGQFFL